MVISRIRTDPSSMKMSRMPVSEKSRNEVSSVMLAAGRLPRASSTASALARIVPPMQKPSVLSCSLPEISRARSIALIAACSM
jgi:hypothetical protein